MDKVELNANFNERASAHGSKLEWHSTPMKGVERRMLERIGDEVARATTIVRYAPGSKFSSHVHTGGEEFFVLDGVFQDEHGDFPEGSYIRNPPQSEHTPGSDDGCTILVKLWQMKDSDRTEVKIDTKNLAQQDSPDREGIKVIPLFADERENVRLENWAAGTTVAYPAQGGIELFVLEGSFTEAGETFNEQGWLRLPVGAPLNAKASIEGCLIWVKEGHLANLEQESFATLAS